MPGCKPQAQHCLQRRWAPHLGANNVIGSALAAFTLAYKFGERQARRKYVNEALIRHQQRQLTGEASQFPDLKLIR